MRDSVLFSGPGNTDFDVLADLPAGTSVEPVATFGDYVQAKVLLNGSELNGWLSKTALGAYSEPLPSLEANDVPWKPMFLPSCTSGSFDAGTNTVTFTNGGDQYHDTESGGISLESPLRVRIDGMQVQNGSSGKIKILGKPENDTPNVPWWMGTRRLDIAYSGGQYELGILDGTSASYAASIGDLPLDTSQTIQIVFDQAEGRSFVVRDGNNNELRHVDLTSMPGLQLPKGLFPERKVYFGTSTSPKSKLAIRGLRIGILADGHWDGAPELDPGLPKLAAPHDITIGTEFSPDNGARYCRRMKETFNLAVLSLFSSSSVWLGPGEYDFSSLDREVDFANEHGWHVRASHLVWGRTQAGAIPDWLLNGTFTRDQYIQLLEQHVKTIVGRYRGRVQEWSIANEAASMSLEPRTDFWNDKIGPDYIEMSFRWAHETDPNAVLIFNDHNNEDPRDSSSRRVFAKMYNTVKALRESGVPIDVVGLQMHLSLGRTNPPKKDAVVATMRKFAGLGVGIYVTELDVDLHNYAGTAKQAPQEQAHLYGDMMLACLESGVCKSFTTWGISDSNSWLVGKEPDAAPLMFDEDFNPKPAYFAVRDALINYPAVTRPPTP